MRHCEPLYPTELRVAPVGIEPTTCSFHVVPSAFAFWFRYGNKGVKRSFLFRHLPDAGLDLNQQGAACALPHPKLKRARLPCNPFGICRLV